MYTSNFTRAHVQCGISLSLLLFLVAPTSAEDADDYYAKQITENAKLVDQKLPDYQPKAPAKGQIKSIGSNTLNNLMTIWGEVFRRHHTDVLFEIEGQGGMTAPPALISGYTNFGPMTQRFNEKETKSFVEKYGHEPTHLIVAIDMLAVYVHKDNPIAKTGLTMPQLEAIFSKSRQGGHVTDITTWGDVGLKGEWFDKPIKLHGRNAASGTYDYFKLYALKKGDFKDSVTEQRGSTSLVKAVSEDRYAIGYSGVGYKSDGVVFVPLTPNAETKPIIPSLATHEDYPLTRPLYLVLNHKPGTPLDAFKQEFIRLIYSKQGQAVVLMDGYTPIVAQIAKEQLKKVELAE